QTPRPYRKKKGCDLRIPFSFCMLSDTPAAIRTRDLQLRRLTLYPAELRVRAKFKIHQGPMPVNRAGLVASREENPVKKEQNQRAQNGHNPSGIIVRALS